MFLVMEFFDRFGYLRACYTNYEYRSVQLAKKSLFGNVCGNVQITLREIRFISDINSHCIALLLPGYTSKILQRRTLQRRLGESEVALRFVSVL